MIFVDSIRSNGNRIISLRVSTVKPIAQALSSAYSPEYPPPCTRPTVRVHASVSLVVVLSCNPRSENMAPNLIRPSQMLIFDPATVSVCYMGQRQVAPQGAGRSTSAAATAAAPSTSPPPAKRTYVKNISPEEKILRKKLRNREAAQLSRDKKKAQFNILSGMVHGLRKENIQLKEEIEVLRFNQEQLMDENERLRDQLAVESSIPKSVVTETRTTAANDRILIEGPAVSNRHPLQKGKLNQTFCSMLCYRILYLLLITPSSMISSSLMTMTIWTGSTTMCQNVWRKLLMNYSVKVSSTIVVLMKWWGAHQKSWNPAKILMTYTIQI